MTQKSVYHQNHGILTTFIALTAVSGFALFLTYVLLLSIDKQFIGLNQYTNTGKYPAILFYISIVFCVVYAFLLAIALFAIWSIIKQTTLILKLFSIFLVFIIILQLSFGILAIVYMHTDPFKLREYMVDNLRSNYTGVFDENYFDRSVDWVQMNYECCGVMSNNDFVNGFYYNKHNIYTITTRVPRSCCIYRDQQNLLNQCQSNLVNAYRKGCFDVLMIWLYRYGAIIGSISIIIAFFHMLPLFYTVKMCRIMDKENRRKRKQKLQIGGGSSGSGFMQMQRNTRMYDTNTIDETLSNNQFS